jgi:hypothetical protein
MFGDCESVVVLTEVSCHDLGCHDAGDEGDEIGK